MFPSSLLLQNSLLSLWQEAVHHLHKMRGFVWMNYGFRYPKVYLLKFVWEEKAFFTAG